MPICTKCGGEGPLASHRTICLKCRRKQENENNAKKREANPVRKPPILDDSIAAVLSRKW